MGRKLGKIQGFHKKVFYFLTGQLKLKKLELRLNRLEHDQEEHLKRFTATVAYYEQRIDALINLYSKKLSRDENRT